MKDKFVIFAEEPPIELQLSTEMRCREVENNSVIDYVKRYFNNLPIKKIIFVINYQKNKDYHESKKINNSLS